jgi:eukaryotic-like serine/threonine-protein kinase
VSEPGPRSSSPPSRVSDLPAIGERYVIERELGRGGMGRVFAARDVRLDRRVAIKLLAAGAHRVDELRRFEQEARLAGSLNDPNVVAVHDMGDSESGPFIVSELLEGDTLRLLMGGGAIPVANAADYALQLANGLAAAHRKGIVHRDLKPENLFITAEGRLKILDFGIAKLVERRRDALASTTGSIVGTVSYMSPEQVRGHAVDHRADLFAHGSILYEMLAGRPAFARGSAVETGSAILNDEPASLPPGVPTQLEAIVRRCLQKNPSDRFQVAGDLADELRGFGSRPRRATSGKPFRLRRLSIVAAGVAAAAVLVVRNRPLRSPDVERSSIAVLPFVNVSGDKENEYFSDGVTEELINALANVQGLRVAARSSAFAYKGKNLGVRKLGEELHVGTVLEGSVRREGNRFRVSAQLSDTAAGYPLWSKTYQRDLKSVFELEDELAREIVQALAPKLLSSLSAGLVKPATASDEAHDLYLQGQYSFNQFPHTHEWLNRAIGFFQKAVERDPAYAAAYARLADSYLLLPHFSPADPAVVMPKARLAASKAVQLDDGCAEAHDALGLLALNEFDWSSAERELRRAIALNPSEYSAHHRYGLLLAIKGALPEAQREFEEALRNNAFSEESRVSLAWVDTQLGQPERAIAEARRSIDLYQSNAGRGMIAAAYVRMGKYSEALAALDEQTDQSFDSLARRAYIHSLAGKRDEVRRIAAQFDNRAMREHVPPHLRALLHVALGDKDRAFALLAEAIDERDFAVAFLKVGPIWHSLRSDGRFPELLNRLHLD